MDKLDIPHVAYTLEWENKYPVCSGIDQEIDRILKQSPYIDDERRTAICEAVTGRIKTVREVSTGIQTTENITKFIGTLVSPNPTLSSISFTADINFLLNLYR